MNRSFAGSRLIAWQDVYFLAVVGLILILRIFRLRRLNDAVARGAALVAYHFSMSKRRRVEANLSERLGGGHSVAERQRIVRRTFYETWRELFSWADADVVDESGGRCRRPWPGTPPQRIVCWTWRHPVGEQRIRPAQGDEENPAFARHRALPGTRLERSGRISAERFRPACSSDDSFENTSTAVKKSSSWTLVYIPHSNSLAFAKTLIGKLHGTTVLCVPGDGQLGRHRVSCEFLSSTSSFATGAVSLARLSNAPLLPVFCVEMAHGGMRVIIEKPLPPLQGITRDAGFESSLGQYAKLLDDYVRRYPEQYRNWHLLDQVDGTP